MQRVLLNAFAVDSSHSHPLSLLMGEMGLHACSRDGEDEHDPSRFLLCFCFACIVKIFCELT